MSLRKINILLSFLSLAGGAALYILLRENSYIGRLVPEYGWLAALRAGVQPLAGDALRYYLPDLLWGFSLSCALMAANPEGKVLCPVLALFCGLGWECLQFLSVVSGTGDWLDVWMYLLGSAICVQINLKERSMKKINVLLMALLMVIFAVFALGSSEGGNESKDQGKETAGSDGIGKYSVVIDSCRLAKDYEGDAVVIVKYIFKNVSDDESASFSLTFDDQVYQNGVSLNKAYILDDSANYNSDNQTKQIKKGASIEVEVAYELNDTTTDIDVEVEELFSFDDTKLTKTFSLN